MSPSLPPPLPLNTDRALSCVVVAIIFPIISTLCVIGRFVARHIRGSYGADDWIILLALLAVYGQMTIIIMSTVYGGVGFHLADLKPENLEVFFKLIAAVQFTFGSSLGLVKISLCALLIRIFYSRTFRIYGYSVMAYCACWMIMTLLIGVGLCRPFAFNWDKTIPGGTCGNADAAYISIAALDIAGDAMIIALPMPMVWKLNSSVTTKIALSFLFALAFLDIIVAILRIYYLTQLDFNTDFTWDSTGTYIWSIIEPSLAVIIACGAVLRPLFEACIPSMRSKNTPSESKYAIPSRGKGSRGIGEYSTSESDIPLHSPTEGQLTNYGRTMTSALSNENNDAGVPSTERPRRAQHTEDQIWVQRDVTLQFQSSHENV